jgi:hypothetical protein
MFNLSIPKRNQLNVLPPRHWVVLILPVANHDRNPPQTHTVRHMLNRGKKVYFQSQTGIKSIESSERTRCQHIDLVQIIVRMAALPQQGSLLRIPHKLTPAFVFTSVKSWKPIIGEISSHDVSNWSGVCALRSLSWRSRAWSPNSSDLI